MRRDFKAMAVLAARAASDKKAEDIVLFYIRRISGLADYLLVATVDSPAQLGAVEEGIVKTLKDEGLCLVRRDGKRSGLWRVLDYGAILAHLMHRDAREFYSLDKLYIGAQKVSWEEGKKTPKRIPSQPPSRAMRRVGRRPAPRAKRRIRGGH